VRFADEGLAALFRTPFSDAQIRQVLRAIVVANYAADPGLAPVAWMFTSDKARDLALGNPNFLDTVGVLQAAIDSGQAVAVSPIEGVKPQALVNRKEIKVLAATLFRMEDSLVRAFQKLESLVRARKRLSLADLEKSLDAFGHSIEAFDEQASLSDASVSPAFAVFDYLIQLASAGKPQRSSALALTVGDGKDQHQFLFQLGAGQQKAAAA
jgi:hypothetical protein